MILQSVALLATVSVLLMLTSCRKEPMDRVQVVPGDSIQRAINRVANGAVILLAPGNYKEDLKIKKSLILRGQGESLEEVSISGASVSHIIRIDCDEHCEVAIENLSLYAFRDVVPHYSEHRLTHVDALFGEGVSVYGNSKVTIDRVRFIGNRTSYRALQTLCGLEVNDSAKAIVRDSMLSHTGDWALKASDSAQVTLIGTTVTSGEGEGLRAHDSARLTLRNATISNHEDTGLVVMDTANVTIVDSTISGNGRNGLTVYDRAQVEVENSRFIDNYHFGVLVDSDDAKIEGTGNTMRDNGVDLAGYAPACLRKPLVAETEKELVHVPKDYQTLQQGIDAVAPGGTVTVDSGRFSGGITVWKPVLIRGADTTLEARKGGAVISVIEGIGEVYITGLALEGVEGWTPTVLTYITEAGLKVWGENIVLQECSVSSCKVGVDVGATAHASIQGFYTDEIEYGLWIEEAADVSIRDSTLQGYTYCGIKVHDSAKLTLEDSNITGREVSFGKEARRIGISVDGSAKVTVVDSDISSNYLAGVYASELSKLAIQGSTISYNWIAGIQMSEKSNLVLNDTTIKDNGYGIRLYLESCILDHFDYDSRFIGKIGGSGNTIPGPNESGSNRENALCPAYPGNPWPTGFLKKGQS